MSCQEMLLFALLMYMKFEKNPFMVEILAIGCVIVCAVNVLVAIINELRSHLRF